MRYSSRDSSYETASSVPKRWRSNFDDKSEADTAEARPELDRILKHGSFNRAGRPRKNRDSE
jgi:hypothetical protein